MKRDRGVTAPFGLTCWLLWLTTTTTAVSQPCPFFFFVRRPALPMRPLSEDLRAGTAAQNPHGRTHGRARLPLLRVRLVVRIRLDPDRSPETETSNGESLALHVHSFIRLLLLLYKSFCHNIVSVETMILLSCFQSKKNYRPIQLQLFQYKCYLICLMNNICY